jgi:hypothetical protein
MVPDITTKWVLRYDIADPFATAAPVSGIRTALDNAKFRWQEIAVNSAAVTFTGNSVVITLPEPLLPGLQWTLHYDEGTFTDQAGNKAVASARAAYWFWSKGAQRPVVRVDRKSFDARATVNQTNTIQGTTNNMNAVGYNATGYNGAIASFNTIAYRINTETPGASIFYGTLEGKNFSAPGVTPAVSIGSVTGAFTARATLTQNITGIDNRPEITWNGPKAAAQQVIGSWVRPNLIFRQHHSVDDTAANGYQLLLESGALPQKVGGTGDNNNAFGGRYYGFRSFNKDATVTELTGLAMGVTGATGTVTASFTYDNSGLEASKNYVAAEARVTHGSATTTTSQKGFEGVFRTVVALNQAGMATGNGAPHPILLCGTNVRSGLPTIAAFPVKDGIAESDARFVKFYYRDGNNYYWVSSEMVCQWFVQNRGSGQNNSSYGRMGDTDDWQTAGYGDLTYTFNITTW